MDVLSPASLFNLQGRVAFVPGGYGDIGTAVARGLALAGARVAVAGPSADKAHTLAAALRGEGHDVLGLAMDAHQVADITHAADAVAAHFGRLDLLVNCVGMQREQRLDAVSEEGRAGDADQAACGGAVGTWHLRRRRGADGGARHDGQPLAGQPRHARRAAAAHSARARGRAADVVGATLLFCSPAAAFVTGQMLYVDGGLTATQ